jgi:hypothetical protein
MVKLIGFSWVNAAGPTVTVMGTVVVSPLVWKTRALRARSDRGNTLGLGVDRAPIDSVKEFADFLRTDIQRWTKLVREAGMAGEQTATARACSSV